MADGKVETRGVKPTNMCSRCGVHICLKRDCIDKWHSLQDLTKLASVEMGEGYEGDSESE